MNKNECLCQEWTLEDSQGGLIDGHHPKCPHNDLRSWLGVVVQSRQEQADEHETKWEKSADAWYKSAWYRTQRYAEGALRAFIAVDTGTWPEGSTRWDLELACWEIAGSNPVLAAQFKEKWQGSFDQVADMDDVLKLTTLLIESDELLADRETALAYDSKSLQKAVEQRCSAASLLWLRDSLLQQVCALPPPSRIDHPVLTRERIKEANLYYDK